MYYKNKPVYHSGYYNRYYNQYYRPMQPVDTNLFCLSANEAKLLNNDVNLVINKIDDSNDFATNLMNAAQNSNRQEVERLMSSLNLSSDVDIHYNPDGIRIEFKPSNKNTNLCNMTLALRWR